MIQEVGDPCETEGVRSVMLKYLYPCGFFTRADRKLVCTSKRQKLCTSIWPIREAETTCARAIATVVERSVEPVGEALSVEESGLGGAVVMADGVTVVGSPIGNVPPCALSIPTTALTTAISIAWSLRSSRTFHLVVCLYSTSRISPLSNSLVG